LTARLRVEQDLSRNRLTVFFRLLLAVPHLIWLPLWGIFALVAGVINWFAVLITARTPAGLHRFLTAFINYATHVYAYVSLAAGRYPGFVGDPGYEVDVEFDPPAQQRRWTVAVRLFLMIPALVLASTLVGVSSGGRAGGAEGYTAEVAGVLTSAALVSWFYALFRGRTPEGVTRLMYFALHYAAQAWAYALVLTDRYPSADPEVVGVPLTPPPHPVTLTVADDELGRARLTVFFRLPLLFPHIVWFLLWSVLVLVLSIVNWLVTLIRGRVPTGFHRFLAAYVRYTTHLYAFGSLVANPFPGFAGAAGSYPVDIAIAPPERQRRWGVGFRLLLVLPAAIINSALNSVLAVVAIFGWFASLFTARMPRGLRNLGAFCLRYAAQTQAYALLLTSRYPYAGPPAGPVAGLAAAPTPPEPEDEVFDAEVPAADDPRLGWKDAPFIQEPGESA
jgi:Domain of unknown function (DUF4389)